MTTRREFLGWGASWALVATAGLEVGCVPGPKEPRIVKTPTAATFEIGPTSAIAWVYSERPTALVLELEALERYGPVPYGTEKEEPTISGRPVATSATTGFTARVELSGLQADRPYRYRLRKDDRVSDWHYFRTAPLATADAAAHFLVGADVHIAADFASSAFDIMRSTPARFLVSLGDWPYSDRPPRARTIEEYRERIKVSRLRPSVRRMLTRLPMYAIYDDHELTNDWDARFRDEQPARLAAGLKAWDEWFPTRGASSGVRYRKWSWGKHVELFIIDARLYRSSNVDPDGPEKTLLGATQKRWLLHGLRASKATFKILLSSIPLNFGTTPEHWNAFTHERDEVEAVLAAVPNLLVISGDQHWFAAHRYPSGLREFQVGPTQAFTRPPPAPSDEVLARIENANFGEIRIEPGTPPTLRFIARGVDGGVLYSEDFLAV